MKRRLSKTFILCLAVLCMSFYIGASAFAADLDIRGIIGDNNAYADDSVGTGDELYETINNAVQSERVATIENEVTVTESLTMENASDVSAVMVKQEEKEKKKAEEEKFNNVGIAITDTYVNVRKEPNTDAYIQGKLYNGAFVEIVKAEGEWYSVKSGKVVGYVKGEFLVTGEDAKTIYKKYLKTFATVTAETLNVRSKMDEKSTVIAKVTKGEKYVVVEDKDEKWIKIQIGKETKGYVVREYVKTTVDYATAISISEEKALLAADTKAKTLASTGSSGEIIQGASMSLAESDYAMFVALIFSESGSEPYNGKLAVANVILNRIRSSKYPDTMSGVVYQSGQFGPVKNGALAKNLSLYKNGNFTASNHKESIKAANEAMAGSNNIGSRLYFNGYAVEKNKGHENAVHIGNHLFW